MGSILVLDLTAYLLSHSGSLALLAVIGYTGGFH